MVESTASPKANKAREHLKNFYRADTDTADRVLDPCSIPGIGLRPEHCRV